MVCGVDMATVSADTAMSSSSVTGISNVELPPSFTGA